MNRATELGKAIVILALGVAMVAAPSIADEGAEDYTSTIARMAVWAWSRPLGVLFVAVGLVGLYALTVGAGRRAASSPS